MTVDTGYKFVEKNAGGHSWYMMEGKSFISSFAFKFKNEYNEIVSFNGQCTNFRLSKEEI